MNFMKKTYVEIESYEYNQKLQSLTDRTIGTAPSQLMKHIMEFHLQHFGKAFDNVTMISNNIDGMS